MMGCLSRCAWADLCHLRTWAPPLHRCLQEVEQNAQLRVLHEHSEKFDIRAEGVFKYLQIFTAMANRWVV